MQMTILLICMAVMVAFIAKAAIEAAKVQSPRSKVQGPDFRRGRAPSNPRSPRGLIVWPATTEARRKSPSPPALVLLRVNRILRGGDAPSPGLYRLRNGDEASPLLR